MATAETTATTNETKVELKDPSNREFLQIYVPLARTEKTAKEISAAFNDAGFAMTPEDVSTKAAQLRAKFKRDGVPQEKIKNAVPTLKREGRKGESSDELLGFVEDLIGGAGAEEKEEAPQESSEEAPQESEESRQQQTGKKRR